MTEMLIGGIPVTLHNAEALVPASGAITEVAVLFVLHGRFGNRKDKPVTRLINAILERTAKEKAAGGAGKNCVIVALDQRNHGERLVNKDRNRGWKDDFAAINSVPVEADANQFDNPTHAPDMYSIQIGTMKDVSFLIDFLPAFLFPNAERNITDYFISGISLGGHVSWLALANEPRITLGVPIIGAANYDQLMQHRAATLAPPLGPISLSAPHFPRFLVEQVERYDPVNVSPSNFAGKKILCLSGVDDELVNFEQSGTAKFVKNLQKENVDVDFVVEEAAGHALSPKMAELAAAFIWEQGLKIQNRLPEPRM